MNVYSIFMLLAFTPALIQAEEKPKIEINSIRLYLPDNIMSQRIGDATPLAGYIKSLEKELVAVLSSTELPNAKGLFIAVGVKPEKHSKIWCEAVAGDIPAEVLAKLEKKLSMVPPLAVTGGPIAFAIEFKLGGQKPDKYPEMPKVWIEASKNSKEPVVIPDGLFKFVWPE